MPQHSVLIVTNGDAAVKQIIRSGIGSPTILPWRDVLHEGPVPDRPEADLRATRAAYLAARGYGERGEVEFDLTRRDQLLAKAGTYDEVVLWFEHDLYDQLQLIQVLHRLSASVSDLARLSVIVMADYLESASAEELVTAYEERAAASHNHIAHAVGAWRAFTAETPAFVASLSQAADPVLPLLPPAFERLLEELPDRTSGASRTERFVLAAAAGERSPTTGELFSSFCRTESAVFMGDWSFWNILRDLSSGAVPLICIERWTWPQLLSDVDVKRFASLAVRTTDAGKKVLGGSANAIVLRGIDRWIGGTHLTAGRYWCWDSRSKSLSGPHNSASS